VVYKKYGDFFMVYEILTDEFIPPLMKRYQRCHIPGEIRDVQLLGRWQMAMDTEVSDGNYEIGRAIWENPKTNFHGWLEYHW
jgi:hypothetical protein